MNKNKNIVIIGAGVAGISAAVRLCESGHKVTVVETLDRIGGRCYSFKDDKTGCIIDNGQHLMAGAYNNFLEVCKILGTDIFLTKQRSLQIDFAGPDIQTEKLDASEFSGRLGMITAISRLKNLSLISKLKFFFFVSAVKIGVLNNFKKSAAELLKKYKQGKDIINIFWEPLILATMNCHPEKASAKVFISLLKLFLLSRPENSSLIFSTVGLSELLNPFREYLAEFGGELILNHKVEKIETTNNKCTDLILSSGKNLTADAVILAVPPKAADKLLNEGTGVNNNKLAFSPIISAYLWFDTDLQLDKITGLTGTTLQWIFDLNKIRNYEEVVLEKYPGMYSCTISSANSLDGKSSQEILDLILKEIKNIFPKTQNAKLKHSKIIRNNRATILTDNLSDKLRPGTRTSISNVFLAGDWTDTGLPATIESASKSGFEAAGYTEFYIKNTD